MTVTSWPARARGTANPPVPPPTSTICSGRRPAAAARSSSRCSTCQTTAVRALGRPPRASHRVPPTAGPSTSSSLTRTRSTRPGVARAERPVVSAMPQRAPETPTRIGNAPVRGGRADRRAGPGPPTDGALSTVDEPSGRPASTVPGTGRRGSFLDGRAFPRDRPRAPGARPHQSVRAAPPSARPGPGAARCPLSPAFAPPGLSGRSVPASPRREPASPLARSGRPARATVRVRVRSAGRSRTRGGPGRNAAATATAG